jgi:N-acetylglucosamine kinase-like BadF-type ATPase
LSLVLGIDGGGTRTRVAVADAGRVLAHVECGSIKRLRVGAEVAEENLRLALKDVFAKTGKVEIAAACVGVASASMPGVAEWITEVFKDFGVTRVEVVGDHVIALDAAFKGGAGILQIAGTGSNCIGRTADGALETAGGWSSRLGDEGSGYWIGLHSVRRALAAHDREEPCGILSAVGKAWGVKEIDEIVNIGDGTPQPDYSMLAPLINELAEAGDKVAVGVLNQAAEDLATFVLLVRAKLHKKHGLKAEVPVAWTGSVIAKMRIVREGFVGRLKAAAPEMPVGTEETVALEGALWRAARLGGNP